MDARGEHRFKLGSVDFTLSMEYSRIREIEELTGIGIISLAGRFTHVTNLANSDDAPRDLMLSPIRISDIAICLHCLTGKVQSIEGFGDMILKVGSIKAIEPLSDFFAEAIAGAPAGESEAGDTTDETMEDSL